MYDKNWNFIEGKFIDYHRLRSWGKEIIINEEKTKAYAKFIQNSKTTIAEINLTTGKLKLPFFKIEARFPKKIKIRGDIVYFIDKQKSGVGNSIYYQDLGL